MRTTRQPTQVIYDADEDWRAEKLREIGLPTGWRPLDEFLRGRR